METYVIKTRWRIAIFELGILLLYGGLAQAKSTTIQFDGNVTFIGGYDAPSTMIQAGDTFIGTYTYESSTIDSGEGMYLHNSPYGIDILLGGFEFKTSPSHVGQFSVRVKDNDANYYGKLSDSYGVRSYDNSPLSNGVEISSISFGLSDSTHATLSSNALPLIAPVLSDWDATSLQIYGIGNSLSIQGAITHVVLVPEPATLLLLGLGGLVLRKRNRVS